MVHSESDPILYGVTPNDPYLYGDANKCPYLCGDRNDTLYLWGHHLRLPRPATVRQVLIALQDMETPALAPSAAPETGAAETYDGLRRLSAAGERAVGGRQWAAPQRRRRQEPQRPGTAERSLGCFAWL